jgi:hypothetical protein
MMTPVQRLKEIAELIERVDDRCLAVDGPVAEFHEMVEQVEFRRLYLLAKGDRRACATAKPRSKRKESTRRAA